MRIGMSGYTEYTNDQEIEGGKERGEKYLVFTSFAIL